MDQVESADQAVVTLITRGEADLHGAAGLQQLSSILGITATKNTSSNALRRLQAENMVTRLDIGEYRVEDEAFAEWLRRRTPSLPER